ncbi:MAG: hypothetical protein EXR11_12600 [Rhodospirillaceae bacterium]|nr:hypothetical protein [Rhodospirillaceae bacterium]
MANNPILALTFDDHYVDDWLGAAPIFKAHGVRATFFVTGFPNVPSIGAMKLHKLLDQGHEIGFHSVSHANAVDIAKAKGVAAYVDSEIVPGLEAMKLMGFKPTSFAYPYNAHNDELDAALRPFFGVLRARADSLDEALQWSATKPVLRARSCDSVRAGDGVSLRSTDDTVNELRLAARPGQVFALYAHGISDTPVKHHAMTSRGLDYILWSAKRLGYSFATASELHDVAA